MNHCIDGFPFARLEHYLAVQIETLATKTTQIHHSPRNDRIHCKAIQRSRQLFEQTLFGTAAGLQCLEEDLDLPAEAIRCNNFLYCVHSGNWKCGDQQPLNGLAARRRTGLFNQDNTHCDRTQLSIKPVRWTQRHFGGPDFDICDARIPRLFSFVFVGCDFFPT